VAGAEKARFAQTHVERSRGAGALLGLRILDGHHFRLLGHVNTKQHQPREGAIEELELVGENRKEADLGVEGVCARTGGKGGRVKRVIGGGYMS